MSGLHRSAAVPAAVVGGARPHLRGQDAAPTSNCCTLAGFSYHSSFMKHAGEKVVRIEAEALRALADRLAGPLAADFDRAVDLLFHCQGRVVVFRMLRTLAAPQTRSCG